MCGKSFRLKQKRLETSVAKSYSVKEAIHKNKYTAEKKWQNTMT